VKYHVYAEASKENGKSTILDVGEHIGLLCTADSNHVLDGDPAADFGLDFVNAWTQTENFRIFHKFTGTVPEFLTALV
jgi:hypothetical protein